MSGEFVFVHLLQDWGWYEDVLDNIKNPERVAAGLKATVHNPSVSEEAKHRARERLSEMGVDIESELSSRNAKGNSSSGKHSQRFAGLITYTVLAATGGSGSTVEYALDDGNYEPSANASLNRDSEKTEHHRLGGYKATLNSTFAIAHYYLFWRESIADPRVSDAAKDHAKDVLNDNDAL